MKNQSNIFEKIFFKGVKTARDYVREEGDPLSWTNDAELIKFLSSQMPGLPWENFTEDLVKNAFFAFISVDYQKFAKKLRALRKAKGLTSMLIAKQTGISSGLISKWENGTMPNLKRSGDTVLVLAHLYDVKSLTEFLPVRMCNCNNLIPVLASCDFKGLPPDSNSGVQLGLKKREQKETEFLDSSEYVPAGSFAFLVEDNSMSRSNGKSVPRGSTVIVSTSYRSPYIPWGAYKEGVDARKRMLNDELPLAKAAEMCNGKVVCCAFNCGPAMLRELSWDGEKGEITLKAWNPSVKQEPPFKPAVAGGRGVLFAIFGIVEKLYETF